MTDGILPLLIHGEELHLHPARAVIWPRCRTVIVADTHFGKSGHFGRHGIAVPAGSDAADRERLNRLVEDAAARRLVILGDFLHAPLIGGGSDADDLRGWVEQLGKTVDVHVVAGNHDRGGSWHPPEPLRWWAESWIDPPFRFIHDAGRACASASDPLFTLSGHVHPVVRLRGARKGALRVPVFWQKSNGLILPSFGLFTGGFAVRPAAGERLYAAGSRAVVVIASRRYG
jgi:DNA ligase-associated metallophosphoesterase